MRTAPGALTFARRVGHEAIQIAQVDRSAPGDPPESAIDRIQAEADYTKEPSVYLSDFLGYGALCVGLALVLIWMFGSDLALRLRGDILPSRIKTRLERLESLRLAISASVQKLTSAEPEREWPEERQKYDGVAASANALLETAKQGLRSDSIDEESLILELNRILSSAESLAARLQTFEPAPVLPTERIDVPGLSRVQRINRGWERVFSSAEHSKLTALIQLSAMRWPNWSRLATPPR